MKFLVCLSLFSFAVSSPLEQVKGIDNYFPTYFVRAAGNHGHHHVTPTDKFVGFSAGLTKMLKTNDTDLVVYDRVFLNMGNGYDSSTGVFTCPNAGTYAFLVHGVSTATSQLNLDIYRNNNYTVSVFAHVNNGYASGHQSIILQLDQQDTVFVQARGVSALYGQHNEVYSTFSGFMVVPNIGRTEDVVYVQGRGANSMYGANHEVYSTFSGFLVAPTALPASNPNQGVIG